MTRTWSSAVGCKVIGKHGSIENTTHVVSKTPNSGRPIKEVEFGFWTLLNIKSNACLLFQFWSCTCLNLFDALSQPCLSKWKKKQQSWPCEYQPLFQSSICDVLWSVMSCFYRNVCNTGLPFIAKAAVGIACNEAVLLELLIAGSFWSRLSSLLCLLLAQVTMVSVVASYGFYC